MAPLMTFKGDTIVQATILRPTREEPGLYPTPEEEATLLVEVHESAEAPGPSPGNSSIPSFVEPAEQTTTPNTPTLPCLAPKPHSCPPQKGKKLEEIDINLNNSGQWVQAFMERNDRIPEW